MKSKITTKQVPKGNLDLDTFINQADGELEPIIENKSENKQKSGVDTIKTVKTPIKPKKEKVEIRVQVVLTKAEAEKLDKKRGLVAKSAYVRKILQDTGEI
ncbi:unnamed protein product [marine sediment metagenome]|uniref:Uncharacterized protein n=1 Tax=marine sediment metagenome TaxID=412755 RepID=X1AQP6_9ZZZZ